MLKSFHGVAHANNQPIHGNDGGQSCPQTYTASQTSHRHEESALALQTSSSSTKGV